MDAIVKCEDWASCCWCCHDEALLCMLLLSGVVRYYCFGIPSLLSKDQGVMSRVSLASNESSKMFLYQVVLLQPLQSFPQNLSRVVSIVVSFPQHMEEV